MKAFKKNQTVIHFSSWDGKGTWYFTRATVKSCGNVRMTLENAETGAMMGNNFEPNADTTYNQTYKGETLVRNRAYFTLADMTDEEAHVVCLKHGALTIADQHDHYDRCISGGHGDAYNSAIEKDRAELHEPRSMKR